MADDFVANSIHVDLLAPLLLKAYDKGARGLFHFASADAMSKYEFGRHLAEKLHVDFSQVQKGCLADLKLDPPRAPYLVLDVSQTESFLGASLPTSDETLRRLADDFMRRLSGSPQKEKHEASER